MNFSNEIIWLIYLTLTFSMTIVLFKYYGYYVLVGFMALQVIVANIGVIKQVELFGMDVTLGNIAFVSIFLSTDLINEYYGSKKAKTAVNISFLVLISYVVIGQFYVAFTPNSFDGSGDSLNTLFDLSLRVAAASLLSYYIFQKVDIYMYEFFKKMFPSEIKHLWIRNNGSTLVSQLIDTIIFVPIAFYGVYEAPIIFEIGRAHV